MIIIGSFRGNGYSDFLFYDRNAGLGLFYATNGTGDNSYLIENSGWRKSWDKIIVGNSKEMVIRTCYSMTKQGAKVKFRQLTFSILLGEEKCTF